MSAGTPRLRLADAVIRIDSIPPAGRDIGIATTADERAEIATQVGVTSVDTLSVTLHSVRFRGGIRVTGRLTGAVTQPSVVSLEPVHQQIAEPIDRIFLPSGEGAYAGPAGAEVFVDLEGDDLPDHFDGPQADLTDLVVETLALAVDLYPRSPGEALEVAAPDSDAADESPFAALRALRDKPKGG